MEKLFRLEFLGRRLFHALDLLAPPDLRCNGHCFSVPTDGSQAVTKALQLAWKLLHNPDQWLGRRQRAQVLPQYAVGESKPSVSPLSSPPLPPAVQDPVVVVLHCVILAFELPGASWCEMIPHPEVLV